MGVLDLESFALHLRYIYTFYNSGEAIDFDAIDEFIEILDTPHRFTLHQQEESSFVVSEPRRDHLGNCVVLTFPGKESLLIHEGDEVELAYDEQFDTMGDVNNNVYEGTMTLERRASAKASD